MKKKHKKGIVIQEIRKFKLSALQPADYNPRTITDEALQGLAASLERFGCVEPIIVNVRGGSNVIVGGHQRYKVLKKILAPSEKISCVTVDLDKTREKLLNLTLNNPKTQGEFIAGLDRYIESLQVEAGRENDFLDLRIRQLAEEIKLADNDGPAIYKEEELKPFTKTHILLSFPPSLLPKIDEHLWAIIKVDGVEYEQGSN